jgi:hypothetical protein
MTNKVAKLQRACLVSPVKVRARPRRWWQTCTTCWRCCVNASSTGAAGTHNACDV